MLRILDVETGEPISLSDALQIDRDAYVSVNDMMARLMAEQAAGAIRLEPSGEALQRQHVRRELEAYTAKARGADNVRQFAPDRRGGRVSSRAARMQALDEVHRRETVASIMHYMTVEGPAAYRSQAALLAVFDPTVDADAVAAQAAGLVAAAVHEGVAIGLATFNPSNAGADAQEGELSNDQPPIDPSDDQAAERAS